jgi:hypothetical protein
VICCSRSHHFRRRSFPPRCGHGWSPAWRLSRSVTPADAIINSESIAGTATCDASLLSITRCENETFLRKHAANEFSWQESRERPGGQIDDDLVSRHNAQNAACIDLERTDLKKLPPEERIKGDLVGCLHLRAKTTGKAERPFRYIREDLEGRWRGPPKAARQPFRGRNTKSPTPRRVDRSTQVRFAASSFSQRPAYGALP